MKETRIYIVCVECPINGTLYDFTLSDIVEWDNNRFIEEAEKQGWVWSSLVAFAEAWNGNYSYLPHPEESEMRIIEVEI